MAHLFDLQGHRGARGLRPDNTLPSFEAAFDAGVSSVETDLHLTRDGALVLCHDPELTAGTFAPAHAEVVALATPRTVLGLTLAELRGYRALPDVARFPEQRAEAGPLSRLFAPGPFAIPTLADLFEFAAAYAGEAGRLAGKSEEQRERAARVRFDLELKGEPFLDEAGTGAMAERLLLQTVAAAGALERTAVRSFDHRRVAELCRQEPRLTGGVLIAHTAPVSPAELVRAARAEVYCPDYRFLDTDLVRRAHEGGARVLPWTVNAAEEWEVLLRWGVDGITTDYPDKLATFLRERGVAF